MAHRRSRNLHSSLSGNTDQERHTNNLFPQMRLLETLHHPGDLAVRPPNTGVVQLDYLIPFSSQAGSRQIRTIPVCVQIAGAARLDVSSCQFAKRLTRWIVGHIRIHQMKPQEKWTLPDRCQPRLRLVHQNVRGGIFPQSVDALRRRRNPHAVLKVQFVVEIAESERSRKTSYRSIQLLASRIARRGFRTDGRLGGLRFEVKKIAENLESLVVTEAR